MATSTPRFYAALSQLPWPTSYLGKLFLVAFTGTHIPLLGAILYTALSQLPFSEAMPILAATLVATLVGMGVTLWALYRLLEPVALTSDALQAYIDDDVLPDLPTSYDDRAGRLMRNTQQTLTQLDELLTFKTRMLGVVSHDTRGSAHSISLAADAISHQASSEDPNVDTLRDLANHVENAVQSQLKMTTSLLEVARHGEGELTLNEDTEPLNDLVDRVGSSMRTSAEQHEHTFDVSVNTPEDVTLSTDVQKLEQVLSNLVSNAIKYTPDGGTIRLSADVDADTVAFRVSDTGPGIPDAVQEELFEAYQRADAEERSDSTGLGLWICKTFTDALGGRIDVESTPGEGSTFIVSFDRTQIATGPASTTASA
jgi:signal transduction histidine kinase